MFDANELRKISEDVNNQYLPEVQIDNFVKSILWDAEREAKKGAYSSRSFFNGYSKPNDDSYGVVMFEDEALAAKDMITKKLTPYNFNSKKVYLSHRGESARSSNFWGKPFLEKIYAVYVEVSW